MGEKSVNSTVKRVMVIGGAGSGKSTVALQLGEILRLPVIHIDKMYWKAGWELRDIDETKTMVVKAAHEDAWVFDGNNFSTFKERADRADAIVFLDMPTWLRFRRVVWRLVTGYGRSRPDMADGCKERLNYGFLKWVLGFRTNGGRDRALKLIDEYAAQTRTHHLRSKADVDRFLDGLAVEGRLTL